MGRPMNDKLEKIRALRLTAGVLCDRLNTLESLCNDIEWIEQDFLEEFINEALGVEDYASHFGHERHESGMFMVDRLYEIMIEEGIEKSIKPEKLKKLLRTAATCVLSPSKDLHE